MPIRESDSSMLNTLFQRELETDVTLNDIARFFQGRNDVSILKFFDISQIKQVCADQLTEEGWVNLEEIDCDTLWDYLCKFTNEQVESAMDGSGFTNVDDKNVEWLVETLMERDQSQVEQYLGIHGYVLEAKNEK